MQARITAGPWRGRGIITVLIMLSTSWGFRGERTTAMAMGRVGPMAGHCEVPEGGHDLILCTRETAVVLWGPMGRLVDRVE